MTNVEALKALYAALGGDPADVADATTIVDILNVIAAKYEGADDATANAEAIANIAAVAENIGGGGDNNAHFISATTFSVTQTLAHLEIPEGVKNIGGSAFNGYSNLETIVLPLTISAILSNAFYNCTKLYSVAGLENVSSIGETSFYACKALENVVFDKIITIDKNAFSGCSSLKSATISDTIESIGANAFANCTALETITINKPEGSITGAPWGAPETTQIIWNG